MSLPLALAPSSDNCIAVRSGLLSAAQETLPQGARGRRTHVLDLLPYQPVLDTVLAFLVPNDAIEFLSSSKALISCCFGWQNLLRKCELLDILEQQSPYPRPFGSERDLVIFAFKKLGYNCINCYKAMSGGSDVGFFASSSLCTVCSTAKFKTEKTPYVDGIIRFYLSGEESITIKGKAFKDHPFWISQDDCREKIIDKHQTAFRLAQSIYEEKMFFKDFASFVVRPRDDKHETLRKMIEDDLAEQHRQQEQMQQHCSSAANGLHHVASRFSLCPISLLSSFQNGSENGNNGNCNGNGNVISGTPSGEVADRCAEPREPRWLRDLPASLKGIYESERSNLGRGHTAASGTLPLRDLVRSMHDRDTAVKLL